MRKELPFRAWFYFRQGWAVYFAFILAAINTLTVTYYLAIERIPLLQTIFPTFLHYILILVSIGIPILVIIGYAHYKKTPAFKAEADINIEANPHFRRILINTELLLHSYSQVTELLIKLSNNEKLDKEEMEKLSTLKKEINEHMKKRVVKL